jgi:DNA-binding LacI/PurR family transcriptional regulator
VKASIQDVAREAGVSVSTVSRTLSKPDLVLPGTRDKVLEAARKLEYHTSRSAAALKSGQSFRIALLISARINTWFNSSVFAGLDAVLHSRGYDISVFPMSNADNRHEFFEELPVRRNADAVIVNSFNIEPEEVRKLKHMGVPIIGINIPSTQGFDASISIDDEQAMRMAVDHLLSLGHRRIAYAYALPGSDSGLRFSADSRLNGFLSACAAEPQAIAEPIVLGRHDDSADTVISFIAGAASPPTAICFQDDDFALPALFRLRQYGHRVPQDISLIGFDDIPFAQSIGLTTLRQDPFQLGKRAAEQTLDAISGATAELRFETQRVQLLLRETTAVTA